MGLVEAAPIPDDRGNVSFLHWLFPAKKLDEMRKVRQRMEKRLHTKLLSPIRDIYRHMADLLVTSKDGRRERFDFCLNRGQVPGQRDGIFSADWTHIFYCDES